MKKLFGLWPTLLLVFALAQACLAQSAQITGRVVDPSDSPVAGAGVTARNVSTGIVRTVTTSADGYYTFALLPRGQYEVNVESTGFKTVRQSAVELEDGQVVRFDFTLQLGQVTESVEVVAESGLLSSETTNISTVVPNQRVVDLPLAGRNPLFLANLVPGVRPVGQFGSLTVSAFDGSRASIAGGAPSTNNYMIDGVAAENFASGGIQTTLSPDATEEFRIITRNPSAEYGRSGGGFVNIVSKAGTNKWSGSLFEFLQNRQLNANDYFANAARRDRAPFIYNQYGATLGGPVKRDKTFFFFNWEEVKQRQQTQTFRSVPTALQRQGDFSQTRDNQNRAVTIYDPFTTVANPNVAGRFIRTPFANNRIPTAMISPVASAVMAFYPQANQAGVAFTEAQNFFGQASAPLDKKIFGIRMDHNFSENRRLFGRYTYDNTFRGAANFYDNIAEITTSDLDFRRDSAVVGWTETLSPSLLLDARVGVNRYATPRITRSLGFDVTTIGLPAALNSQVQLPVFPRFAPGDVDQIGAASDDQLIQANDSYTASGAITWIRGAHNIKTGAEYRIYRANNSQMCGQIQFYNFGRGFTQGPDPNVAASNSGFGVATFLLGTPSAGQINRCPTISYQVPNLGIYIQDDWKATPRLTLNLGLRYEVEGALTDRFNQISNFDPALSFQANGVNLTGGLTYPGTGNLDRGNREVSYQDFAPRLGLSYQLFRKTIVRAAYGISYLPTTGVFVRIGQTGFSLQTPMTASVDGVRPFHTLANPFPNGVLMPTGSAQGALTGLGTSVGGNVRNLKRGYSQQWNFNVQQELPGNVVLELGYMGNRGVSLPANREFAYLPESALALGSGLQELVTNPFAGLISTGPLAQPRVTRATLLRTHPQFLGASGLDSWADSIYHAATLRAEKRFSDGLSLIASYTFSKLIDNNLGNGLNGFADGGNNGVQNWDNLAAERAVSTSDLPQRLVLAATYELPFAKTGPAVYRHIAGGWQINSILTLQSGNVIAVSAPAPAFGGNRPNVVGDPSLDNPTIDRWLNRDAFTAIAPFTFGNAPRNLPRTRTDGMQNIDLSLFKNFAIRERYKLQLRGEFFNFTNTPTFGNPSGNIAAGDFGVIRSLATNVSPRRVQLALKFTF